MSDDARIGRNLAALRVAAELSQGDLADKIGVAQQTVAKIEKGTRPLKYSEAVMICSVLRVPVSALADREPAVATTVSFVRAMTRIDTVEGYLGYRASLMVQDLFRIASRLAAVKFGRAERPAEWDAVSDRATAYLETDWGDQLNEQLTYALRAKCLDANILSEVNGESYRDILSNLANADFPEPEDDAPAEVLHPSLGRGLASLIPEVVDAPDT